MPQTWLVFDVDCLGYRAFYKTGHLEWDGQPTGVVYGVLQTVRNLMDRFNTQRIVFCFDDGEPVRKAALSSYKGARKLKREQMSEDDRARWQSMKKQINDLKTKLLFKIGFMNVLWQYGYEADDLIASVCHSVSDDIIIVSSDQDLYQLLSKGVCIYHPQKDQIYDRSDLIADYGITPRHWAMVKAIAGCTSDSITGVPGVGEVTAIKYITGELPSSHRSFKKIIQYKEDIQRNLNLTTIPYPGTMEFEPKRDDVTEIKWRSVTSELGMYSLAMR
jgi:DNA polymerase I